MTAPPRQRRRAARLLAGIAGVVVALAGVECMLRAFAPQPLSLSYLAPDGLTLHIPGASVRYTRLEFSNEIRIDSLGLRDRELAVPRPGDLFRILVLGDSYVEGKQVRLEEVFAKRLEAELRRRFPARRWEVVNAGVSGYGTADELELFETVGRKLEPQVVIVAFAIANDVQDNRASPFVRWRGGTLEEIHAPPPSRAALIAARVKEYGASHFHLWQFLRDRYHGVVDAGGASAPPAGASSGEDDWRLTEILLDRLAAAVAGARARLLVAAVPARWQIDDEEWARSVGRAGRPLERGAASARLASWARARGIPYVDLLPALRDAAGGGRVYYRIDAHWTARGHAVVAAEILKALVGDRLIPVGDAATDGT